MQQQHLHALPQFRVSPHILLHIPPTPPTHSPPTTHPTPCLSVSLCATLHATAKPWKAGASAGKRTARWASWARARKCVSHVSALWVHQSVCQSHLCLYRGRGHVRRGRIGSSTLRQQCLQRARQRLQRGTVRPKQGMPQILAPQGARRVSAGAQAPVCQSHAPRSTMCGPSPGRSGGHAGKRPRPVAATARPGPLLALARHDQRACPR
jgi:hypothetical protein